MNQNSVKLVCASCQHQTESCSEVSKTGRYSHSIQIGNNQIGGVVRDGVYLPIGLDLDVKYCIDVLSTRCTLQELSVNSSRFNSNLVTSNSTPINTDGYRPVINNKKKSMLATVEYSDKNNMGPVKTRKIYSYYW
jgi:hypothetical protein